MSLLTSYSAQRNSRRIETFLFPSQQTTEEGQVVARCRWVEQKAARQGTGQIATGRLLLPHFQISIARADRGFSEVSSPFTLFAVDHLSVACRVPSLIATTMDKAGPRCATPRTVSRLTRPELPEIKLRALTVSRVEVISQTSWLPSARPRSVPQQRRYISRSRHFSSARGGAIRVAGLELEQVQQSQDHSIVASGARSGGRI